jgi:aristolochene synthase
MRFGAKFHLTEGQLVKTQSLESTAFRHVSVINDIYSWEREWKVSQTDQTDGARPFSAVYILSTETGLPFSACKRLLYSYCRELELVFKQAVHEIRHDSSSDLTPEFEKYLQGLEYFMSGIETWSQWTPRYRQ